MHILLFTLFEQVWVFVCERKRKRAGWQQRKAQRVFWRVVQMISKKSCKRRKELSSSLRKYMSHNPVAVSRDMQMYRQADEPDYQCEKCARARKRRLCTADKNNMTTRTLAVGNSVDSSHCFQWKYSVPLRNKVWNVCRDQNSPSVTFIYMIHNHKLSLILAHRFRCLTLTKHNLFTITMILCNLKQNSFHGWIL